MDRRGFIRVVGTGSTVLVAGCLGGERDGPGAQASPEPTGTNETARAIDDHPAATDLADQPRRGDLGGHVVLAFEDPSCTRCRAFERQTVPRIEQNLVDTGKGAYVVRNYPVVYPWGKPAVQALEATFARDEEAFWKLHGWYFDHQDGLSTDDVLDRTATYLSAVTDLDGEAVAADAEAKTHDDAVQADIDAAKAADARGTPTVYLFRDGEYVARAAGSVSYDLIAAALGES